MGPASMPSVPLMVGCGVSCTALLILLLIYAAFWRYTPDSTLTLQLCSGDLYHNSGFPTNALSALLCLPRAVPKLHRGLMRNKWFKYSRGWWLDSGNTHDRWQNQANDSAAPKKILFSPSIRHLYLSHKFVTLALSLPSAGIYARSDPSSWWIFASPSWPRIYWFWWGNLKRLARWAVCTEKHRGIFYPHAQHLVFQSKPGRCIYDPSNGALDRAIYDAQKQNRKKKAQSSTVDEAHAVEFWKWKADIFGTKHSVY